MDVCNRVYKQKAWIHFVRVHSKTPILAIHVENNDLLNTEIRRHTEMFMTKRPQTIFKLINILYHIPGAEQKEE